MKVTLGITAETTYSEFLEIMHERGLRNIRDDIRLSPEEYAVVAEKFVHRDDIVKDGLGPLCWKLVKFRPEREL